MEPISEEHFGLSYVKTLCVATATNLMELAKEEISEQSLSVKISPSRMRMMLFTYQRLDEVTHTYQNRKECPTLKCVELHDNTSKPVR